MNSYNREYIIKLFWFLFNPLLGLVTSFTKLNSKLSLYYLFAFGLLYGLAFTPNPMYEFDSNYYLNLFESNTLLSLKDVNIDGSGEGRTDAYVEYLIVIVKWFSVNYHLLFFLFALIFGFFAINSVKFLVRNKNFENGSIFCFLLFIFFMLSNPIFNINGVRFWTAAWISVFLALHILVKRNIYMYPLILILPVIHPAFWIMVILVILCSIKGNIYFLIYLYFLSFFLSSVVLPYIVNIYDFLPGTLRYLIDNYSTDESISTFSDTRSNASWFISPFIYIDKYFNQILIIVIIREIKKLRASKNRYLISFVLLLAIFVNLTYEIPSVGVRFNNLLPPLICVLWIQNKKAFKKYDVLIYLIPFILMLKMYEFITYSFAILDPYLYISPVFVFLYHILVN
ncbi:MAG: EpsG family protein [Bacteroidetes bacterium]|nr:EpsG family protein [Bacteroidota bacterium]